MKKTIFFLVFVMPCFAQTDPQPVYIASPDTEVQVRYFLIGFGCLVPLMVVPLVTHYARRARDAGRGGE